MFQALLSALRLRDLIFILISTPRAYENDIIIPVFQMRKVSHLHRAIQAERGRVGLGMQVLPS